MLMHNFEFLDSVLHLLLSLKHSGIVKLSQVHTSSPSPHIYVNLKHILSLYSCIIKCKPTTLPCNLEWTSQFIEELKTLIGKGLSCNFILLSPVLGVSGSKPGLSKTTWTAVTWPSGEDVLTLKTKDWHDLSFHIVKHQAYAICMSIILRTI